VLCLSRRQEGPGICYNQPDETYNDDCLVPTFQQSSIRIMIWSCIGYGWKGPLVMLEYPGGRGGGMTAKRYQEQVLELHLKELYVKLEQDLGGMHFQQEWPVTMQNQPSNGCLIMAYTSSTTLPLPRISTLLSAFGMNSSAGYSSENAPLPLSKT
jgi:hypothetical protein